MTNVTALIKSIRDQLPKAEKRLGDYILKNPGEVLYMTAQELGEVSGTSAATVIRLSKKLEMKSFSQLKIFLHNEWDRDSKEGYSDITPEESIMDIKEKLLGNAYQSLSDTLSLLDNERIEQATNAIEKADIIYIFGMGSSYLVAENIGQKYSRIGKTCIVLNDIHGLITAMVNSKSDNLFIGISNSGRTSEVLKLIKLANKNNMQTMSITQFGNNPISNEANIKLQHIRVNEPAYRGAATVSLHVQFYLVDVLFYTYSSKHYEEVMHHIITTREEIMSYKEK
ncbi:MurR/RpiR family transcriptional regulator [Jeotgalibaca sp. MA1X17-3]|uniref:MurR/RpiR family transcriptional regulator n=1 Tax=Jeotgalibaca sp. MA1X17-3 TaxID=2908211 RepID=UPI001F37EA12|nr:MurR/RpiR family transcriptional regulator [Jeotgalibaca sp. MA1X17-3]UJF14683.1 MurR/RpiR family transcriptional regulator [Jeotgalibaca sp. MA1X17-3]